MASLIKIGNSKGIRIPQPIIKQAGLEGEIEFIVTKEGLLLKPVKKSREGWRENIEKTLDRHRGKDDGIIEEFLAEPFDEWEW